MEDWGRTFERLLEEHRRDDGSRWSGAAIERASGGEVKRQYVSDLRRGLIHDPSYRKILHISRAMGISLEAWAEGDGDREGKSDREGKP